MISLEKIQIGDQKFQFKCEHCDQIFNDWNLNISIFLYGVFFLSSPDRGVIGITCPKCLKDIAIEGPIKEVCRVGANLLSGFQNGYQGAINQLAFFSSVNYHKEDTSNPNFDFCHYASFNMVRKSESLLIDLINDEYGNNPWLETDGFSISLLDGQHHIIGHPATVGWVKNDSIEKVIDLENDKRIKLIDRYYNSNPIFAEIDKFCWNFKYLDEFYGDLAKQVPMIDFTVSKPDPTTILNDLLEIVFSNHPPFAFPTELNIELDGLWKTIHPFKAIGMPQSIHHLEKNRFDKSEETDRLIKIGQTFKNTIPIETRNEFLRQKAFQFIEEYETAFKKPDFSYAHLWEMKLRYADMLMDAFKQRATIPVHAEIGAEKEPARHSSVVRLKCREVAQELWARDPEITIEDMAAHRKEIGAVAKKVDGKTKYKEGTIKKWIKDLCPNRKPGRRPKKD